MGNKAHIPWKSSLYPAVIAAGFIVGCASYFLIPFEPSVTAGRYLSIAALFLTVFCHKKETLLIIAIGLLSAALAFTHATMYIQGMQTSFLKEEYSGKNYWLIGHIETIHFEKKRAKLLLTNLKFYGMQSETPQKIRITVGKNRLKGLQAGDWVATQALLYRPSPLKFAGDFDFQRHSYLKGIGAWGYVRGSFYKTASLIKKENNKFNNTIFNFRKNLTEKIVSQSSEKAGGVMAALLTGMKDFIPKETQTAFRQTGLAHILAISGMHLALIAGMVFFASRRIIGCTSIITLRVSSKKLAAIIAFIFTFAYMFLAGATLPTVRAFIMLSLLFLAIWLERVRLGLRVLSFAAILVLLLWPHVVISASFQMSFVAVLFLVLWAEQEKQKNKEDVFTSKGYIKTVIMSSFVAGMATLPIAAWHFNTISFSGVLLNLAAIPLTGFLIMPAGLGALLTMPFGLEAPFLWGMDKGVSLLVDVAIWGQGLPLSGLKVSQSMWLVLTISTCFLLLSVFMRNNLKKYAVMLTGILLCIGIFYVPYQQPFNMLILNKGNTVLLKQNSEFIIAKREHSKEEDRLLKRLASQINIATEVSYNNCDSQGCLYHIHNNKIFFPHYKQPLEGEDCHLSTFIYTEKMILKECEPVLTFTKTTTSIKVSLLPDGRFTKKSFSSTRGNKRVWQGISIDGSAGKH